MSKKHDISSDLDEVRREEMNRGAVRSIWKPGGSGKNSCTI
jgi:hypothetical protein